MTVLEPSFQVLRRLSLRDRWPIRVEGVRLPTLAVRGFIPRPFVNGASATHASGIAGLEQVTGCLKDGVQRLICCHGQPQHAHRRFNNAALTQQHLDAILQSVKREACRGMTDDVWKHQPLGLLVGHGKQQLVYLIRSIFVDRQHQAILSKEASAEFSHRRPQGVRDAHGIVSPSASIEG